MILYTENLKTALKNFKLSEFGKFARPTINIQKSVAFLYTKNELSEREMKITTLFIIESTRIL